jgi:hypothetical protein
MRGVEAATRGSFLEKATSSFIVLPSPSMRSSKLASFSQGVTRITVRRIVLAVKPTHLPPRYFRVLFSIGEFRSTDFAAKSC